MRAVIAPIFLIILKIFEEIGVFYYFNQEIRRGFFRSVKNHSGMILEQIATTAVRSFSTVCFAGFFVGAILVIQFQMMLDQYDAGVLLGGLNTSGMLREIGPLIISFLLAGKIGAYTAAEIATMRVTEQIDAIRCLGTDPVEYLVIPRFVSILVSSLLLLLIGLMVGIAGGIFVAQFFYGMNYLQYLESVPRFLTGWTVMRGLFKSATYGWIVASVATYKGYTAKGGAKGVGIAVTQSAIYTNLFIVFANTFTTLLLDGIQELYKTFSGGLS